MQDKRLKLALGVALLTIALVGSVAVLHNVNTHPQSDSHVSDRKSQQATTKSKYSNAELFAMGELVPYQSVDMRVNTVRFSSSISGAYSSPKFAEEGTKFVIVNVTLTNKTTDPFTYAPFVLIDQKDRLFNPYEQTIGNIDDYLEGSQLAPSVPKTGNAVYQIPRDSTELRFGGGVGSTSKLRLVKLQSE